MGSLAVKYPFLFDDFPYLLHDEDDDDEKNEGKADLSSSDDDDEKENDDKVEDLFQFCKSGKCTECSFNSDCPGSRVNFS